MGHLASSHYVLTLFYTISALEPSEVVLLTAGAQPNKVKIWDTVSDPRPLVGSRD